MSFKDDIEHDERAWELRQAWIDSLNEAVRLDNESKKVGKLESGKITYISLKELSELRKLTEKADEKHTEAWRKRSAYFEHLQHLKSDLRNKKQDKEIHP